MSALQAQTCQLCGRGRPLVPLLPAADLQRSLVERVRRELPGWCDDYLVNLKAELEIRLLHEKVDHLLQHQWERLVTIQEIQLDLMSELTQRGPQPQAEPR